jgi:hypothetical protein
MAGENFSINGFEAGVYTIQSVEQFDALIASTKSSGRVITIKDASNIEIHEASLEQLTEQGSVLIGASDEEQGSVLIGASDEQLGQFRKNLLLNAQLTQPANQAAAQLLQGEGSKNSTTTSATTPQTANSGKDFAQQAFEAAAEKFTQDIVEDYSKVKNKELLSDIVNWAEQIESKNKISQLQYPSNKDFFAFRDGHPVGKDYDTHKREYIDSLREGFQAFIAVQQRLPSTVETFTIAGNALLAGYENFLKNEVFNSKISKLTPEQQEQFHDLKASLGGDADQALQEGATRLAVSRRFASLLEQELSIVNTEPITISKSIIGKAGQKQITKELENSTKDPTVVGALSTHSDLPHQFVLDSSRSTYKFIEAGNTHAPARARDAVTQGLNTFVRGNEKAAFALAAVANQATLGSLYKAYVVGSVPDYKLVPAPANREADPVGYTLERLPNNNVRLHAYQLQGLRTLELIPAKPRSTLPSLSLLAAREPEDIQIDESNYGVRGNVDIELDGKALEKGKLQIVRHAPYSLDVRLKLDWAVTSEVFTG